MASVRKPEASEPKSDAAARPEPAMAFVQEVLKRLSEGGVRYCVLRNYQSLPQGLGGTDLDLLVRPEDREAAFRVLGAAASGQGGAFLSHYRAEALISSFCGRAGGEWWGVQIDVFPGVTDRGVAFYDAGELLERTQDWRGIPVAPEGEASVIALLKELLRNGASRKDYHRQAAAAYAANPEFYDKRLLAPFGLGALGAFREYLTNPDSPQPVRTVGRRLRWALCRRAFCRHPWRVSGTKVSALGRRLRRLLHPPGLLLAVSGADPARRSALIARIRPVLEGAVHGHVHLQHLRPGFLPGRKPYQSGSSPEMPVSAARPGGVLGCLRALFDVAFCALDCAIGYWAGIYPALVKKPCIWIFDRYFDDLLVPLPARRTVLPRWVVNLFAMAVPQPDILICLGSRPDTVPSQEPEAPAGKFNRGEPAPREDTGVVWIEDGTPEDMADRALSAVVARASARSRTGTCQKPSCADDGLPETILNSSK